MHSAFDKEKLEFDQTVQNRWLISCVIGVLSVSLPFTPVINYLGYLSGYLFLPLWICGVCMGVFSLLAKEKNRAFAFAGILLSLAIPAYSALIWATQENPAYRHEMIDSNTGKVLGLAEFEDKTIYYTKDEVDSPDKTEISEEEYMKISKEMSNKSVDTTPASAPR